MVRASSSATWWAAFQVSSRRLRASAPIAFSTWAATSAVSAGSRMPASRLARTRAAAEPASRGVAGAAPAAVKSPRMSLLTVARSQRRSPGRRVTWAASMRDSSSMWAAWHQLAASAGGGQTLLWAAWPPSWVRAPQMTG